MFMEIVIGDGPELGYARECPNLLSLNRFNSGAFRGKDAEGKMDLVHRASSMICNEKDVHDNKEAVGWDTAWILYPKRTLSDKARLDLLQIVAFKESTKAIEGLLGDA